MTHRITELTASGTKLAVGLPYLNNTPMDFRALVSFYENNKYPLVYLETGRNGHDFFKSAEFLAAREQHAKTLSSFRGEYLLVRNR